MTRAAAKAKPGSKATTVESGQVVKVSSRTVQAARLRQTINSRLGKSTSPVTVKIANVGR